MKQVLQHLATGRTELADIPCPQVRPGHLLVRTASTLVSAGTERMLVEFGKANLLDKARQQPDKVRMVVDKIRTDGLAPTLDAVRSKLDQPLPLGYCNAGVVAEVGAGVEDLVVGDRVVNNGHHAQVVSVPRNLCARIPAGVDDEAAAFTVLGAIALQGIRLAAPTLGEAVVVTGLGLIGLLSVQLLRAHGCRVLGLDYDRHKLDLAERFGAQTVDLGAGEDPLGAAEAFSRGRGVDAVLITASTKSNEPVGQAATMCRKRGRIVLVGVTGLELSRADFYEKELSFQVSCSYGPGRYDPHYEEAGVDYPVGFVRWTEQRNFEAVLDMLASGALEVAPLVSHRFPLDDAASAYTLLGSGASSLGIVLDYPKADPEPDPVVTRRTVRLVSPPSAPVPDSPAVAGQVGFVGAGNYAGRVLIPAFRKAGARLRTVATRGGVSGVHFGKKFGFEKATTDTAGVLADADIDTLVIATRHDTHGRLVCDALAAGKHVFVEKPLCLSLEELARIEAVYRQVTGQPGVVMGPTSGACRPVPLERSRAPLLMVGFNRRFAPQVQKMKALLDGVREPKSFIVTVNAGMIAADHWTQDPTLGGGRIVGEGCHFVDLLRFLAAAPIVGAQTTVIGRAPGVAVRGDKMSVTLQFGDGSFGTVHYLANGHKAFPKERLEVFCAGRVLQLDNFRRLRAYGWPKFRGMSLWRQDKGQGACVAAFLAAIEQGKPSPIPFDELIEVSRVSIEIARSEG